MNGQRQRDLLDDIIAEDTYFSAISCQHFTRDGFELVLETDHGGYYVALFWARSERRRFQWDRVLRCFRHGQLFQPQVALAFRRRSHKRSRHIADKRLPKPPHAIPNV